MTDDNILELTGKIEETLGAESFAMISDTIGEILTGNSQNMKTISDKEAQIKKLQDRNEKLVVANGALLQKVPMVKSDPVDSKEETPKPKLNIKDAFDAKGNFIH